MNETSNEAALYSTMTFAGITLFAKVSDGHLRDVPDIISGSMDQPILCAFHYFEFGRAPVSKADLDQAILKSKLDIWKQVLANKVLEHIGWFGATDTRTPWISPTPNKPKTPPVVLSSNKPHELGTVNEISVKYGISKSEVRRRKQDGTLQEYINTLSNKSA